MQTFLLFFDGGLRAPHSWIVKPLIFPTRYDFSKLIPVVFFFATCELFWNFARHLVLVVVVHGYLHPCLMVRSQAWFLVVYASLEKQGLWYSFIFRFWEFLSSNDVGEFFWCKCSSSLQRILCCHDDVKSPMGERCIVQQTDRRPLLHMEMACLWTNYTPQSKQMQLFQTETAEYNWSSQLLPFLIYQGHSFFWECTNYKGGVLWSMHVNTISTNFNE